MMLTCNHKTEKTLFPGGKLFPQETVKASLSQAISAHIPQILEAMEEPKNRKCGVLFLINQLIKEDHIDMAQGLLEEKIQITVIPPQSTTTKAFFMEILHQAKEAVQNNIPSLCKEASKLLDSTVLQEFLENWQIFAREYLIEKIQPPPE